MKLILNVDDLGLHPAVTRAVIEGAKKGVITSASVLANGADVDHVAKLATNGAFESLSLGAHLNILRGVPIAGPDKIPSLVGNDGLFLGSYTKLFNRYLLGRLDLREVELEFRAQIGKLRSLGIEISHLDSEKHIHAWPNLMRLVRRIARQEGVTWVRRPVEPTLPLDWSKNALKARLLGMWCGHHARDDIASTDAVWGIVDQGAPSASRFERRLAAYSGAEIVEAIIHPGLPEPGDPSLPQGYESMTASQRWLSESCSILEGGWPDMLRANGIVLTNFR
jgi:chitin disaccharide deacetylase